MIRPKVSADMSKQMNRLYKGHVQGLSASARVLKYSHKDTGSIASAFNNFSGNEDVVLPSRFVDLKKDLFKESLVETWRDVLASLKLAVEEVSEKGADMIPRVDFNQIKDGRVDDSLVERIKRTGTCVIEGGVPLNQALGWEKSILEYVDANEDKVKGFPQNDIQVYEFYNSIAQTEARAHPNLMASQKFLLGLLHSTDSQSEISLQTPISYFDRVQHRKPDDESFALGPHIDGGSLERWEDPGYRSCWKYILDGNWRKHDPFDVTPRLSANFDLYGAIGGCSVYRPYQGLTAITPIKSHEGTLRVLPIDLRLTTAYTILRPFFTAKQDPQNLDFDNWKLDLDQSRFPGCAPASTLEMSETSHPHLQLSRTVTSLPDLKPGDQFYWHSDVIHAVNAKHNGDRDSGVFFIPAVPLTVNNAHYLKDQVQTFKKGLPGKDFPQGEGESRFVGRMDPNDVLSKSSRQMLGLERFTMPDQATPGEKSAIEKSNNVLFE
ncbi:DUF1479-domain-containing protein [Wallemia mellicola]|uniref:DUF1479-domain-containing protein n=3 Tax=Wallemia mellicola TaxID=1708541 RepID=A0A4T0R582_9BASI|nr:hypothetical protein E3Q24_01767 [Wallemia mellicola]TIB82011.1 DUF1479-domain-containing protein [Wallemia mellicola]TIB82910.1 DUF1479-domain-containing protein [Wallemia mellicola]TIB84396.1 DUF1479-domain-containing protein [Wallemia mellicola]TIB93800.1 DUF1479-domain-containing protein [Wallemia mellicola]